MIPKTKTHSHKMSRELFTAGRIRAFGLSALRLVLVLAFALLVSCSAYAQTTFGSLVGAVTDASGASVPGAKVTLTSQETGTVHALMSGDNGTYSFVSINPGKYRLDVDKAGFKHLTLTGIEIQVGSNARADASMQIGAVTESVEVTSAAPLIQTDSGNLGGVIEEAAIRDIPISGRNVNNLLATIPGVIAQGSTNGNISTNPIAFGNYQIGGGFGNQSIFFVDGVQSNIPENNTNSIIPSQDIVKEFRVSTSNVSAEFGGFAGGVVNINTKTGTNNFHGSAYEYIRNKVLNANNFFSNRNGLARQNYVQNQFGATAGGPIQHNKTFVFGGYERETVGSGGPSITTVATTPELNGDFSNPLFPKIYDPTTGQQFQCNGVSNVICPSRIDPTLAALLKISLPSGATNNNLISNNNVGVTKSFYNLDEIDARGDRNFGIKDQAFVRYAFFYVRSISNSPYPGVQAFNPGLGGQKAHEFIIGNTFTANPTTILDGRISYLRTYQITYPRGLGTDISGASPGLAAAQAALGQKLPLGLNFSGTGIAGSGAPGQLYWHNNIYTISGSVTKILGRHTVKAGFNARSVQWIAVPESGSIAFTFTAAGTAAPGGTAGTGNAFASALIGTAPVTTLGIAVGGSRAFLHNYGFYIADNFQMSKKLTLDLGLRWDQPGSYSEANDWNTVILPNAASPIGTINNPALGTTQALQGKLALVNSSDYPSRREENLHWKLFDPRVGLAYRLTDRVAIHAGYGISFLPSTLSQDGPNSASVNTATTTLSNTAGQPVISTLANPFPNGILTPSRRDASRLTSLYGQNIQSRIPNQAYSYVQQWNLAVEKAFGNTASVSLAYGGAKGTHLQAQGANTWSAANINQIPDKYLALGSDLETRVANPFYGIVTSGQLAAPTVFKGLLLKPSPQYNYITAAGSRNGDSTYHSLQVSAKKRFTHGGILTLAYTHSKLLSDTDSITQFLEGGDGYQGTVQNNNNLRAEKSLSSSDYPNSLVIGYGIDLPFGSKQMYLSNTSAAIRTIISGWRVNGLTSVRSGTPLGLLATPNEIAKNFGGGGYYQNGVGQGTTRPNVVPGCVKQTPGSRFDRAGVGAANSWFNTSCFVYPGDYAFGNESRMDSSLRRDGVKNFDFSTLKSTALGEKASLDFTAEFFNIFNRTQFSAPATAVYDGANYGKVSAQFNNPRQIQFGLRLTY